MTQTDYNNDYYYGPSESDIECIEARRAILAAPSSDLDEYIAACEAREAYYQEHWEEWCREHPEAVDIGDDTHVGLETVNRIGDAAMAMYRANRAGTNRQA